MSVLDPSSPEAGSSDSVQVDLSTPQNPDGIQTEFGSKRTFYAGYYIGPNGIDMSKIVNYYGPDLKAHWQDWRNGSANNDRLVSQAKEQGISSFDVIVLIEDPKALNLLGMLTEIKSAKIVIEVVRSGGSFALVGAGEGQVKLLKDLTGSVATFLRDRLIDGGESIDEAAARLDALRPQTIEAF